MWQWEEVDAERSGSSGDLSKLFKNEGYKTPGILAANAPSIDGTILARESIQNSWDAARALQGRVAASAGSPEFRLVYSFQSLEGPDKSALIDSLGLRSLRDRAANGDRRKLGLREEDCLAHLDDDREPLRVLVVHETGTTGMDGPWGPDSKMYLALVSIGFTQKETGAGGSYGYGKAGLIRASAIRTVLGYSAFAAHPEDHGVTRRLLGMTYWGQHKLNGTTYTGFARWAAPGEGGRPFEDDAADSVARDVGLELRSPGDAAATGTTFLLVDPTVEPSDLCRAVERNWWPALEDGLFDVTVEDYDCNTLHPRHRSDNVLKAFVRGYELATTSQDNDADEESVKDVLNAGQAHPRLGRLGLVADLKGWSYARGSEEDEDEVAAHKSLVALVRGPRMVVEYFPVVGQPPHVRGTFVADPDVDDLLRQTEPKAHDAWLPKVEEEGVDPAAPKVANKVRQGIRRQVKDFRSKLRPPPPRQQDIRLPVLDNLFRNILDNQGQRPPPPPRPDPRLVSISVDQGIEKVDETSIRLRATARVALNKRFPADQGEATVGFRYAFDEDGRLGEDCGITVTPPSGFSISEVTPRGTLLTGVLQHEIQEFALQSDPYPLDWTGQLIVTAEPVVPESTPAIEVGPDE